MNMLKPFVSRSFLSIFRKKVYFQPCALECKKYFFTEESLRITEFLRNRRNVLSFNFDSEEFKKNLKECLESDDNYLIFTDDFKKMIKISQTDEDLVFVIEMLKRYNDQSASVKFESFNFGPEVLRLYYVLNKPAKAYELLRDAELSKLFNHIISYVLVANLLFVNKMYEEVVKVLDLFIEKQYQIKKYPSALVSLAFGALYKLNTPESYNKCLELFSKLKEEGFKFHEKAINFFSCLALNQNHTFVAIEVLEGQKQFSTAVNIKALALAKEKRYNDALYLMRDFLFSDSPRSASPAFITKDVLQYLEEEFKDCDEDLKKKLEKIKMELIAHNFISLKSLDEVLCAEEEYKINKTWKNKQNFHRLV